MAIAFATSSRTSAGTWWLSVNSRANAALPNREVDLGHRAGDPGVVEHRSQVEELTVERDPLTCGDGRAPRVGTTRMVEERGCQEVPRGELGVSCESGVGRHGKHQRSSRERC